MKKWKQAVVITASALIISLGIKVQTQAALPFLTPASPTPSPSPSLSSQVTGVKQTGDSTSSVTVSCNADINLAGEGYYVAQVSDNNGATWSGNWSSSSGPSGITIRDLAAGKTYLVRVSTYKNGPTLLNDKFTEQVSAASAPVEVVTAPNASDLKAEQSNATANSISITMSGAAGSNYYALATNTAGNWIANSNTPTVTASGLAAGTKYTLYAYPALKCASTGYVAYGSAYMMLSNVKTLANKLNTNNFGITSAYENIDTFYFGVASGLVADGYEYQFKNLKGDTKKTISRTGTSGTIRIENFVQGTFYKYRVRSYVQCGSKKVYSAYSPYRYIGMPKSVGGNYNQKRIKCNWSKVNGASKYVISMSKDKKSGYKKIKTLKSKKRDITIKEFKGKKLKKGSTYYVKIVAKGKDGSELVKGDANWIETCTISR